MKKNKAYVYQQCTLGKVLCIVFCVVVCVVVILGGERLISLMGLNGISFIAILTGIAMLIVLHLVCVFAYCFYKAKINDFLYIYLFVLSLSIVILVIGYSLKAMCINPASSKYYEIGKLFLDQSILALIYPVLISGVINSFKKIDQ